ncbi:hypothetical protein JM84_1714 [Dokdonia sp. Hel_I_63]|uniref:hypothetical protein n=1 Tax=Dokdonia sp. Hel_I_63 TaxID=1249996 RepID=UPI00119C49B5|nr:hypothetical protein [Dokdonia sp. Hel_I_63]TVZ22802.1 hypothetical protein JM84_1714 [Dokdonia sp. Hel_I_63]
MEIINDILSDIANISLVVFGFTATLFTVLYSFIINKRENLKEFNDRIKGGEVNPILGQRKSNAIKYISNLRQTNLHLICSIFFSLLIYTSSIIVKYLSDELSFKFYASIIIFVLAIILIIHIVYLLIKTIKNYLNEIQI